ncbi:hypothetical protein [Parendozoicomonas sp. Alg238-R29]|uniref:hypothetical protein n=1 Tax=Parendozoicomonas sp. Alg238-R29 TaxID=2993446 RepID=UPI00248E2A4C|nr:hypothetical protein [Parendozoicomonas sp. Alg238-R29]
MPIYTKEMLDLMTVLRRRLKAEFDIVIRFSGEDTLATIQDLARRSADTTTKNTALQLLQLSGKDIHMDDLARPTHKPLTEQAIKEAKPQFKSVRIYRGQVVA